MMFIFSMLGERAEHQSQWPLSAEAQETLAKVEELIREIEQKLRDLFPPKSSLRMFLHRKLNCGWRCFQRMDRAYRPVRELTFLLFQKRMEEMFPPNSKEAQRLWELVHQCIACFPAWEHKHATYEISHLHTGEHELRERARYLLIGEAEYREHSEEFAFRHQRDAGEHTSPSTTQQEAEDLIPRSFPEDLSLR